MKKTIYLTLAFIGTAYLSFGQTSNIKMFSEYPKDSEIRNILNFEKIDYFYLTFVGKDLIGKGFSIELKDIWNGELKDSVTLIDTEVQQLPSLENDTLRITVISKKLNENLIKMQFKYPWFESTYTFKATSSDAYSLRTIGTEYEIETDKEFFALAYTLPYEKDGWKMYCEVENSGTDAEAWGKKFGIEHYLLFEMTFK
jgi:hypothetical protein